jgi:hypothetical protein
LQQTNLPTVISWPYKSLSKFGLKSRVCQPNVGEVRGYAGVGHSVWVEVSVWEQMMEEGANEIGRKHLKDQFGAPFVAVPPRQRNAHVFPESSTGTTRVVHELKHNQQYNSQTHHFTNTDKHNQRYLQDSVEDVFVDIEGSISVC